MTIQENPYNPLEPEVSRAMGDPSPTRATSLELHAVTRTADRLDDIAASLEYLTTDMGRIATALEGLLLVLDTRGEVSGYLERKTA